MSLPPRVLIIAGSDSSGGAGIQADIKTASAFGAYAMTAITAVTAQNTAGVHGFHAVPPDVVAAQINAVLSDIGAGAIKTGMLVSAATVEAVAEVLEKFLTLPLREDRNLSGQGERKFRGGVVAVTGPLPEHGSAAAAASPRSTLPQGEGGKVPLVVDTVMIAKGGAALLDDAGVEAMRKLLFPMAALITPNAPEAARLTGLSVETPDDLARAGKMLVDAGAHAVLMKGGHLAGDIVTDVLVDGGNMQMFRTRRIENRHTHGTGCTLATAIATGLAQGHSLQDAVERARDFVQEAIRTGLALGKGTGPVNPMHGIRPRKP